jgi:IS5 family transposase
MFKALILQAQHNLSDARMEFMIRDRLSWMRFLKFDLGGPTPDENTIRLFRNKLTETGTLRRVMKAFDWQLQKKGYIPMSGQIVDASLVPAPKQRNTDAEKDATRDLLAWASEVLDWGREGWDRAGTARELCS